MPPQTYDMKQQHQDKYAESDIGADVGKKNAGNAEQDACKNGYDLKKSIMPTSSASLSFFNVRVVTLDFPDSIRDILAFSKLQSFAS